MKSWVSGRSRGKRERKDRADRRNRIFFTAGLVIILLFLGFPLIGGESEGRTLPVMKRVETEKEEVVKPDAPTSGTEPFSVYDEIGRFFASFLFGESA